MRHLHIHYHTTSKRGRFVRIDATPVRGRPAKRGSSPLSLIDANQETQVRVHRDQAAVKVTATSKNKRTAPRRDCGRTSVTKFVRIDATPVRGWLAKRGNSPLSPIELIQKTQVRVLWNQIAAVTTTSRHKDNRICPITGPVAPKTLNPNL